MFPCTVPRGNRRKNKCSGADGLFGLCVKLGLIVKLFHAFKSIAFLLLTILKTKYEQFKICMYLRS